jgi:hypothetical protein
MKDFIRINNSLVNAPRLLALQHKPHQGEGSFRSAEHYLAIFDTGKELWLSPEDGAALMDKYQGLVAKPPDGMMATTSETAT